MQVLQNRSGRTSTATRYRRRPTAVSPASARWSDISGFITQADEGEGQQKQPAKNGEPEKIGHVGAFPGDSAPNGGF